MNCILLSGGLFQIYSNINENYLSYEDLTSKICESYIENYPNIKNTFNKYKNIKELKTNNNKDTINYINTEFLNEINKDTQQQIDNLFKGKEKSFETIVLNNLYLFFDKFNKIYFNYDNLLYLLIDYNIFKLLNVDISHVILCLNINEIFNNKDIDINPQKYIVFDICLENLLYYHSLGCFTVYLSHLVKMDLKTDKQIEYIDNFNNKNLDIINDKGIFFDFSFTFMIQCINYIKYIDNYEKELKNYEGNNLLEKIRNKTGAYNVILIYRFFFKKGEIKRANFFICTDKIIYTTYIGDYKKIAIIILINFTSGINIKNQMRLLLNYLLIFV